MKLPQTLIQGSAGFARRPRRRWDRRPTPEKLIRTPTPALQNAGLVPQGRPSSVLARREGSHTASAQKKSSRGLEQPGYVPGANPSNRGPRSWRQRGSRARCPRLFPARGTLARLWPQFGRQLPGTARWSWRSGPFAESSRRTAPTACLRGEEPFAVEDLLLAEQVVDGAAQAGGERPEGAGLAVLLLAAGEPALGLLALAEEQAGSFGEGPFAMGVAD